MHSYHLSNILGILVDYQQKHKSECYYGFCSQFIIANLNILVDQGFISSFSVVTDATLIRRGVTVFLKYDADGMPVIQEIVSISTPGRRVFLSDYALRKYTSV